MKELNDFPGYGFDTDLGQIWSFRRKTPVLMMGVSRRNGCAIHITRRDGYRLQTFAHVLLCEAEYGPAPEANLSVAHLDGNLANNRGENLRWNTFGFRFARMTSVDPASGCWIFSGSNNGRNKYGRISYKGSLAYAHRASFDYFVGDIKEGFFVCHHCDNPVCVNPGHLFQGTAKDNMQDMKNKCRGRFGETSPFAKLTESQVMKIRKDQRKYRLIAETYGVCPQNIENIKNRKTWRHLP